jgi:hypothetical protein
VQGFVQARAWSQGLPPVSLGVRGRPMDHTEAADFQAMLHTARIIFPPESWA